MTTKDWTEKMKEQLDDFQVQPSDDVWAAVEARLAESGQKAQKRKLWPVVRRLGIAASLLVLVAGGGFWAFNEWMSRDGVATYTQMWQEEQYEELTADAGDASEEEEMYTTLEEAELSGSPENGQTREMASAFQRSNASVPHVAIVEDDNPEKRKTEDEIVKQHNIKDEVAKQRSTEGEDTEQRKIEGDDMERRSIGGDDSERSKGDAFEHRNSSGKERPTRRKAQTGRLSLSLYAQGLTSSSQSSTPVRMSNQLLSSFATPVYGSRQAPVYLSGYEERESHDMPLSAGLTASWQLSQRWRLVSGMVYTSLSSQFETIMPGMTVVKKQRMHYVGIPFGAQYDLWSNRRLRLYGGAQAQADINVNTKVETNGVRQSADNDRLRLSVGLSAGLQLNITPTLVLPTLGNVGSLSLYAEPSARYWIDNGCSVKNYFTEHPLGASLQLGLRFDF